MSDANANNTNAPQHQSFPFITVGATLGVLFVFLFLMWTAARKENPLEAPKPDAREVKTPPNLDEIKARNEAALNGVGAKMPREEARGKLLASLKSPNDKLPFPKPEPQTPAPPKKDDKTDKKDKKDEKNEKER
jgi:hypothetical protein